MLFARSYPLRLMIILPFSFLFFVAAAVFCLVSYQNSETLARSMGHSVAQELGKRIEQYVESLTEVMPAITDINAKALLNGNLSQTDLQQNTPWLLSQLQQHPQLSFVSIAMMDGRFVAASRPPNQPDHIQLASNIESADHHLIGYAPSADQHFGEQQSHIPGPYDPSKRPFVQCAIAAPQQACWGDIYHYLDSDNFGISLSRAVVDDAGKIIAVVAADIALNRLNNFMAQLDIGFNGLALLVEQHNGKLIASSNTALIPVNTPNRDRYQIANHPSALLQQLPTFSANAALPHSIQLNNTQYLLEAIQIDLGLGLSWQLVVLLPVEKIAEPIIQQVRDTVLVTALILLLLIFIGAALARKIAGPIENIAAAASQNTLNQLATANTEKASYTEVDDLKDSLAMLAKAQLNSIHMLEQKVQHRTLALQQANERLTRLSEQDPLTGIANRRVFSERLKSAWQQALEQQQPLSVILCDIDYFKSYNDHFGHQAGDEALRTVAKHLESHLPGSDGLVARYGGEEFILLLPNTSAAAAGQLAETLRQTLCEQALHREDVAQGMITLSFGYSCICPTAHDEMRLLIKHADEQLYQAKANGRNQVQPALTVTD
ncbi:diguanylate cyclase [Shewanella avicenniae]|uniref:diguanylate cyclase n=1 Tax=Shewanella avicenniae TaxID=2814294 RepID=A0ABX7QWD2_9GAMM|nr:diguanylate cyclase [Shewanella avicenniae]QSX34943.1 diguanylate cyclase [Shewanella avicenniae]